MHVRSCWMDGQQRIAKFEVSLDTYLEPGEKVVAGAMGRAVSGRQIIPFWGSSPLTKPFGIGRMVALTDRRIIVARTSVWWGWRVQRVIKTFPATTPVRVRDAGIGALIDVEDVCVQTNRVGKRGAEDLARRAGDAGG